MILSNRTINTQIWCLLLDQDCSNEHHLPVPFPYVHCDRGGVGRGWGVIFLLLIAHLTLTHKYDVYSLTKFVQMNITYSWCPMVVGWNLLFVIVCLVGQGWSQVQKKLTELEIYLFLLYSCSKILVYMMLSNRIINTQIWCLLLDQVCPNEHHLPVPFPHIHCDRGAVGRGWGSPSFSSLLSHQLWITIGGGMGRGGGSTSSSSSY